MPGYCNVTVHVQLSQHRAEVVLMPTLMQRQASVSVDAADRASELAFMLQDSAEDLHTRMGLQLPEDRWRPNIVTEGAAAWSEDLWERIVVTPADGSAAIEFASVRPCDRCKVRRPLPCRTPGGQ